MTPDTSIQKAIPLTGDGANGKSTYLRAVLAFISRHNASALSLHKLENDRFSAVRRVGRLANICPDPPTTDMVSASVFKVITGGDPLMAEYKFQGLLRVHPVCAPDFLGQPSTQEPGCLACILQAVASCPIRAHILRRRARHDPAWSTRLDAR
jgi:hypothetical protein